MQHAEGSSVRRSTSFLSRLFMSVSEYFQTPLSAYLWLFRNDFVEDIFIAFAIYFSAFWLAMI